MLVVLAGFLRNPRICRFYTDGATQVKIGIYVISFYSINEQTMVCIMHIIKTDLSFSSLQKQLL